MKYIHEEQNERSLSQNRHVSCLRYSHPSLLKAIFPRKNTVNLVSLKCQFCVDSVKLGWGRLPML